MRVAAREQGNSVSIPRIVRDLRAQGHALPLILRFAQIFTDRLGKLNSTFEEAARASQELAEERGAFPDFEMSSLSEARRNVALLTVAPTGTTSMLMRVSSGVENVLN